MQVADGHSVEARGRARGAALKVAIAVLAGWAGFTLDRPFHIVSSPFLVSLVLGSVVPMTLTMAWGWRIGMAAATLGLAAAYPLRVWPDNGWANVTNVGMLILWFLVHGWAAGRRNGGASRWWHNPYVIELGYDVLYAAYIMTLFRWMFGFNPAPWAAQAQTFMPASVAALIATKNGINGMVVVLLAGVALHLAPLRRLLRLRTDAEQRFDGMVVMIGSSAALLLWVMDAMIDGVTTQGTGWWRELLAPNPEHVLSRLMMSAMGLGGALAVAALVRRRLRLSGEIQQLTSILEHVVENAPFGMHLYDLHPDGRLEFIGANPAADRLLGVSNRQFHGKSIEEAFPALAGTEVPDRYREVARTGTVFRKEEIAYKDDRIVGAFDVTAFQTRPNGMVAVFTDITERRRMEERLRQSEKLQAVGQLAGGVAHDFNNQLGGIMGFAELLVEGATDATTRDYATKIMKSAARAAELTQQLLSFSRGGNYVREPVDARDIIGEVVDLLNRSIDKRIVIRQSLEDRPLVVMADPTQLQGALLNLGLNARDAMPAGGTLTFSARRIRVTQADATEDLAAGDAVRIGVADTGVGMDAKTLNRLFEPFFTTKPPGRGTGLGLASAYGSIKSFGGTIQVHSAVGKGSLFEVTLPACDAVALEAPSGPAPFPMKGHGRLLVVDDERVILELHRSMLKKMGYEVVACEDPVEAVALYRKDWRDIDLVILDMIMPTMGGRELFQALRDINPNVKAVLSTGYALDEETRSILALGVKDVIRKPFRKADLVAKIDEVLRGGG